MTHRIDLRRTYDRLYRQYGPQGWWPATACGYEARCLEICIGAILTQHTNWANVEKALANLRDAGVLTFPRLHALPQRTLERLIRPSGYYHQKARTVRAFLAFVHSSYSARFHRMFAQPSLALRAELLSVRGIGKETADSLLLYAGNKPIFVIDAYTKRLLAPHSIVFKEYDDYRTFIERRLPRNAKYFQEYHALIVAHGKNESSQNRRPVSTRRR